MKNYISIKKMISSTYILLTVGIVFGLSGHAQAFSTEPGDACIKELETGLHHTCILKADGNVNCYGLNGFGQANDYTGMDAIGISVGDYHTCILIKNGNVHCYGFNEYGQAEDYFGKDAVDVSTGGNNTCILKVDGNVECYGDHLYDESKDYKKRDAIAVSTRGITKCILTKDGNVDCNGFSIDGQGDVYNNGDAEEISVGWNHSCVLTLNGDVDCFGANNFGQANDYTAGDALKVTVGDDHTCILTTNGNVHCYGSNLYDQLINYNGGNAVGVSAGAYHTCILKDDGNITCSGSNLYGQANDYSNEEAACSYHQPEMIASTVDILNDLYTIEITNGMTSHELKNVFLEAVVKLEQGSNVWNIDPTTVVLSKNDVVLATGESFQVVDNVIKVRFPLNLANVSLMLNLNVLAMETNQSNNFKVKVERLPLTALDLIDLTVSGVFFDGGSFSNTDAIRVTN